MPDTLPAEGMVADREVWPFAKTGAFNSRPVPAALRGGNFLQWN
jgi:hypothetical protein